MLKIFASYKRADRPFLDLLLPLLRRVHGKDSIWFDDDIPGGSAWWPVILYHIDLCPAFVFLMSNDALRSEYCLAELREAIRLNKQVFPVICRLQTELPKDLDPELATFLRNRNWITLVNRQGGIDPEQMVRLNEDIRDALNQLPADSLPPKTDIPTPEPQVKDKPKPKSRFGGAMSWGIGVMIVLLAAIIFAVLRGQTETPSNSSTPTLSATTAIAVVDVESPTPTESPTDSSSATPSDTPTLTLSPTITDTPDFVVAAQTVAAQGTLDYDNARAAETVMAATLYSEQTATQTALYEQQTATQAAIGTATATQWTKTPTPDATLTITALIADWATQTQAAHFTATATLWTNTPTPTSTFTLTHTLTPTHTPTFTSTPTPTPNATQTLEAFARTPMPENAAWTPVERYFDGVTMVLVPAGCFMMGSADGASNERPVEEVCSTEPFWLDKTEVTQAQFVANGGVKANANGFTGENRPVERITWREAVDYCVLRDGRLPTEAEWEFAARGPDGLVYPWGNEFIAENVVYSSNSGGETAEAGDGIRESGASWVGALDLSGNVWEWTSSLYRDYPYDLTDGRENLDASGSRVLRGGSWVNDVSYLRAAGRGSGSPGFQVSDFGFRCARS